MGAAASAGKKRLFYKGVTISKYYKSYIERPMSELIAVLHMTSPQMKTLFGQFAVIDADSSGEVSLDSSDPRSEQALRDGAAAFEALPVDELDFRTKQGTALVFGNERRGVSRAFVEHADRPFYIPMCGLTQSFNISVAVAMSLYSALASGQFPEGSLDAAVRNELLGRWLLRDVKASRQLLRAAGLEFTDF